jgi:hypothetical protein
MIFASAAKNLRNLLRLMYYQPYHFHEMLILLDDPFKYYLLSQQEGRGLKRMDVGAVLLNRARTDLSFWLSKEKI